MNDRYHTDLAPITVISVPGGVKFRAECNSCGAHEEWRVTNVCGADVAQRHFTVRGWTLKRRAICPQCQSQKKEPKPMATITKIESKATAPIAANTDAARKNKRLVIVTLEDCYNETKRRYNDGHSDTTVAKELDLAPGFVALVREEFYGKMAEPTEFTELRGKLAELTAAATDLSAKFAAMAAKNGWQT